MRLFITLSTGRFFNCAISVLCFFLLSSVKAEGQDLTIDEAISKLSASSQKAIISGYQTTDQTGDFQFVDAEIKSVHDFNDYSYGSMIDEFNYILHQREIIAKSDAPSSMWPDEKEAVLKQNPRMLEYVKDNMTRIVGYSAVVDFVGVTKYRERKDQSVLLYFDAKGDVVDVRSNNIESMLFNIIGERTPSTDRDDAKNKLAPYMFRQVVSELSEQNDPLFLRKDYWKSEIKQDTDGKRLFEMQWCYRFTKENTEDLNIDKGLFRAYYYQIQKTMLQTIKMILIVDGKYEKDKEHIWLSYNDSTVKSYHIVYKATKDFSPGDYKSIDYRICDFQLLESIKVGKLIQAEKNTPDAYKWIDNNSFEMIAPFIGETPCTFTRIQ